MLLESGKECFVDVYGDYRSLYSISNFGNIVLKSDGSVVESSYTDCRGYRYVYLTYVFNKCKYETRHLVHKLVYSSFSSSNIREDISVFAGCTLDVYGFLVSGYSDDELLNFCDNSYMGVVSKKFSFLDGDKGNCCFSNIDLFFSNVIENDRHSPFACVYRNVKSDNPINRWEVRVSVKGVTKYIGSYMNETLANRKVVEFKEMGVVTSNKRFV